MTTTPGPRTEAGKRFYDELIRPTHPITVGMDYARQRITEIEAEARADVDGLVARLRTEVEALTWTTMSEQRGKNGQYIDRADVLALLSAGDKAEAPE